MARNSNDDSDALRAFCPYTDRDIQSGIIPRGSVIRVVQRVRDVTDGSERNLYIATISPLPNGGYEITTLVGEDEVLIEVTLPAKPDRNPARGRHGRRS